MTRDDMDEIKRHFDVVAESLSSQIGVVAEGHQLLAEGQNKIVQRLEGLEQTTGGLVHRIEGLEQTTGGLVHRMGGLEQRMGGLEQRIDRFESEIKAMLRLSFVELERRVLGLETTVEKLVKRVDRLDGGPSQ